jgi:hypothetical protein
MVRVPPESSAAEVEEIAFVGDADGDLPAPRTYAAWTARLVYYLFALAEILIALRVLLKLIAASQESGFTRFISSLLGIVVYLLACWLLVRLVQLILERPGSVRPAPPMPDE